MYRVRYARIADPRLGRHVNHDPRSRRFPVRAPSVPVVSIQHERHVPVFDQGSLGSCTGNAAVGCMGTGAFFGTVSGLDRVYPFDEGGAVMCYGDATRIDSYPGQYPPDDTGSDGLSVAKALKARGEISGYEHAFSLAQGLQGLMVRPQIVGINWYEGMFDPSPEGIVHPTGSLAGGHEPVWDGYDDARGLCWFTNSWSEAWGKAGRFAIPAEEFGKLLEQDGDVTSFVPITSPSPAPVPGGDPVTALDRALWAATRGWSAARHVGSNASAARAVRAWAAGKGLQ